MKFVYHYFLFFMLTLGTGNAQNLALNGGFETYSTLPNYYAQSCYATGWQSPSGGCALVVGQGSPDYYHTLGSSGAKPPATWWSNVMPHTGNAMQGFAGWYNSSGPYREYVQYHLSAPMVPGTTYDVSYYITNGITTFHGYGCNHIGAYFSTTAVTQTGGTPMPYVPQVQDTNIFFSTTWQKKTFKFTPTVAYNYVTIGNFYNNVTSSVTQFVFPSTVVGAYYYIDDVVIQPAPPLPVELVSFFGENIGNINHLYWTTASEINNDYFDIEKSSDEKIYKKIGTVKGSGNSTQILNYVFDDRFPANGIHYYRLKQVDFNGDFAYSKTIAIYNKERNTTIRIATTNEQGIYVLFTDDFKNGSVKLFDFSGRLLENISFINSGSGLTIDLQKYNSGMYFINIVTGDDLKNIKLFRN